MQWWSRASRPLACGLAAGLASLPHAPTYCAPKRFHGPYDDERRRDRLIQIQLQQPAPFIPQVRHRVTEKYLDSFKWPDKLADAIVEKLGVQKLQVRMGQTFKIEFCYNLCLRYSCSTGKHN